MIVKGQIDLKGNNISTDSYDSSNPLESTNGQYDPAKAGNRGDVATNLGITDSLHVGNANIYGHTQTGAGGSVYIGPNGAIGDHTWQASNLGVEPGWYSDTANFCFPDTTLPYTSGLPANGGNVLTPTGTSVTTNTQTSATYPSPAPSVVTTNSIASIAASTYPSPVPSGLTTNTTWNSNNKYPSPDPGNVTTIATTNKNGNISYTYSWPTYTYNYTNFSYTYALVSTNTIYTTNTYDHILYSGDYYATDLSGSTIVLGQARLVLPNGLVMANKDAITVAPGGALTVWSDGTSCNILGNAIVNSPGIATDFTVYCTPTVTAVNLTGNGTFVGILVAPNAAVTMNGGGSSVVDFCGCLLASSVKMNGHFRFHYDEMLSKNLNGRYLISSWNEIQVN
jgi:hypothetical protein